MEIVAGFIFNFNGKFRLHLGLFRRRECLTHSVYARQSWLTAVMSRKPCTAYRPQ